MKSTMKVSNSEWTVDDVLFVCMSLGAVYNQANAKGVKTLANTAKKKLKSFVFKHVAVCKLAADKFKSMTDDERSEFVQTYEPSAAIEKELKM